MNYAKNIIENAEDIAACVILEKDGFGRTVFTVKMNGLGNELRTILEDAEKSFQEKVTSEMRHTDTLKAVKCCTDAVEFSIALLESNIPDKLKIALFKELNIVGYMFDRNRRCYAKCNKILEGFLDAIEGYKKSLSSIDLQTWNNSTYAGAEQVSFFRSYLAGIMARSDA